ncbi:hypothetical protein QR685DRAFT_439762, partial [Neurospora intermedia]
RYLSEYFDLGIELGGIFLPLIVLSFYTYIDASFINNIPLRKSIVGYIFLYL